jgi:hypothetical protein
VRPHADRTHSRASAAVRDAERLVQVEVADVSAEATRSGQSEQRVEIGPVDIDLSPGVMHQLADLRHTALVYPVR